MQKYDPKKIERKWQKYWAKQKTFVVKEDSKKKKFYSLVEFPYPSGEGLHVGHPRPFTAMDVISRKKRMEGYNVLYPMGFDAFGLPTENFAIKTGRPPAEVTKKNIATFTRQLKSLGYSFDWSRAVDTTDPKYYKWTQWIFLQFFKHGLAYKKNQPINWCPKDKIGLANEEVVQGCCERCGAPVELRNKEQWMLAITKYADKLLTGLKDVDYIAPARVSQENWIGKSEGAEISFELKFKNPQDNQRRGPAGQPAHLEVFTTRPDTIFGATYLVLAPEHPLVALATDKNHETLENKAEVRAYLAKVKNRADRERVAEGAEKTGVCLKGVKAINPATNEAVPLWVADYVLPQYGAGAIMAVPAHDERDYEFAKKFNLPIKQVVAPHVIDSVHPPVSAWATKKRKTAHIILENVFGDKILLLQWKGDIWGAQKPRTFILGGVEENENLAEAAEREVKEETGYQHLRLIKQLDLEIHSEYSASHKKENRYAVVRALHFKLADDEKGPVAAEELEKHEPIWIDKKEVKQFLNTDDSPLLWECLTTGGKALTEDGIAINSDFLNDLKTTEAKEKIIQWLEEKGIGKRQVNYKLRDWVFSRQRYWGEPIPIVICSRCGYVPVPEEELPLQLPPVKKYQPTDTGESPLSKIKGWVNTNCPRCTRLTKGTKHLIFDFDGVLADTFEESIAARIAMGNAKNRAEAIAIMEEYFGGKSYHARGQRMTDQRIKEVLEWTRVYGTHLSKSNFKLFVEFIREIKKIKNAKIAIVSSGSPIYLEDGVKKTGLKPTHVLSYEDHRSKEEKVERICRAWGIDVNDAYYFTDTKVDVFDLEGVMDRRNIIGCAWGYQGYKKLKEILPENQILKKFSDILALFKPGKARRETDTMPNWAGSSWYFLRYCDPRNSRDFADPKKLKYWLPVDWYNGGMEQTVLHLLYSRFWNQFLYDIGEVPAAEPYKKRTSHGMILGSDGEKMSKSRGNVINPDEMVEKFGADAFRCYIMFMGPFDQAVMWDTNGLVGTRRFLERVWALQEKVGVGANKAKDLTALIHQTIQKVTADIDAMRFNTAIARLMELVNEMTRENAIVGGDYQVLIKLLAPFAPHLAEELWEKYGAKKPLAFAPWPSYDPALAKETLMTLAVQVNGKVRATITASADVGEDEIKKIAVNDERVKKWLEEKELKKIIYVKGKLVSVVV